MSDLLKQVDQPQDDSTRLIPLTRGKFAIVDAADYEWLNQWKWNAHWSDTSKSYYAHRTFYYPRNRQKRRYATIIMSRLITGAPNGQRVDHGNRDTLDNRRRNLRPCTNSQNLANRPATKRNSSGFKGVSWHKASASWAAKIRHEGKDIYIGCFAEKEDAARAYDAKAIELFGEFSYLNFPHHV